MIYFSTFLEKRFRSWIIVGAIGLGISFSTYSSSHADDPCNPCNPPACTLAQCLVECGCYDVTEPEYENCISNCNPPSSLAQFSSAEFSREEQDFAVQWAKDILAMWYRTKDVQAVEFELQDFEDHGWVSSVLAYKFVYVYCDALRYDMSQE